jgi:hypothetical protein
MLRKIIFGSFIVICLAGGIYWFLYTKEARTPVNEGINAIPSDAAIIFESKQAMNTWRKLSQTNIMWEELLGTQTFAVLNGQAQYIDSLLRQDPLITPLLEDHSVFISAHTASKNSFHFLFVYSLPNRTYREEVEDFFEKANNGREIPYSNFEDQKIGTLKPRGKMPLYFSFVNGTLSMSTNSGLLEKSIKQLNSGTSVANDKNFRKVLATAGKKVDANIYVNYKTFPNVLGGFISPAYQKDISAFSDFADCSGWDVTIKPNALMLSGFTSSDDSIKRNYLNIFNKQKPQLIELTKVIPQKTALMIFYGISNTKTFHAGYKEYLKASTGLETYDQFKENINSAYHLDIEKTLLEWIDSEMALVVTEPSTPDFRANAFALMHSNNIEEALSILNAATDSVDLYNKEKTDTSSHRGHRISHLNLPGLLPGMFGWQFSRISDTYFTSVDDYIVFGNSVRALQNFINDFENNHILTNDKNYQSFAENISTEANIYIYSSIARSTEIYKGFVTEEFSSELDTQIELLHKFESAGIQFSFNNKLFYSNVYLKYNPVYKQETGTLWESKLDTTISTKPYLLINHNTKAREVFVQDDQNKVYLISNTGKIIWTKQLHEKIMSDVVQVDVLKNNKLQLLFNTRSFIYMFDRNGNDMKGFPVKLRSPATSPISLMDYENNRDYRIFVACDDRSILCFKATGEAVIGFKFGKTANPVYLPVQYFKANNKDHLCVIDVKGKIYILDRHGEARIKMKEQMAQGIRNFYIEAGKDYSKSFIVAADTLGNIIKLSLSGDKEKTRFQEFETTPYFEYKDINNDKTKEYIFLTRNELKIFNADKSLLFQYEFNSAVTQTPQFFLFPDGNGKIGITCEIPGELYLFNDNGSLYDTFPLKGKTAFSIGDLNNEGSFNLVTGSADNSIYVYQLY